MLLDLREGLAQPGIDVTEFRAEADRRSNHYILAALRDARPGDAVLSEEAKDDSGRLDADRVWIVDPLDGTREFAEEGRQDWAVHVALWERGALVAGAVALPAAGLTLSTVDPPQLSAPRPATPRLLVSRTRPPTWAHDLQERLGWDLVPMGSAGAKAMAVIRGQGDVYVHAGGQYEWDSAAPVAVARAAGLHTSRVDGSALAYNQPDPWLPDLVICPQELSTLVLDAMQA